MLKKLLIAALVIALLLLLARFVLHRENKHLVSNTTQNVTASSTTATTPAVEKPASPSSPTPAPQPTASQASSNEPISILSTQVAPIKTTTATLTNGTPVSVKTYDYGTAPLQDLDVYTTAGVQNAPIVFMVHGGAWVTGDKANGDIVKNKANDYLPKGYIFISINYPMLNQGYKPDKQRDSVALAVKFVQAHAAQWGGDPSHMVLMGHSAGAHLVSMVSDDQDAYGLAPWSGTVLLDSAAYDLVAMMQGSPSSYYVDAFGSDQNYWIENSPLAQLTKTHEPIYEVCSSVRAASDCDQAQQFANKIKGLGGTASVYPVALKHDQINSELGLPSAYTTAVDDFIAQVIGQ